MRLHTSSGKNPVRLEQLKLTVSESFQNPLNKPLKLASQRHSSIETFGGKKDSSEVEAIKIDRHPRTAEGAEGRNCFSITNIQSTITAAAYLAHSSHLKA